jgi:SAM-dependent methyltransferase
MSTGGALEVQDLCRLPLDRGGESKVLRKAAAVLTAGERLHLSVRFRSAPWHRVVEAVATRGDLLDVGCGPGLLAHLARRGGFLGTYVGIDLDPRKVDRANRWLHGDPHSRFETRGVSEAPREAFGQVAVIDVLYLVPRAARPGFVAQAAAALKPGGAMVVLTSGGGPEWKRRLDRLQERLAIALGVTRGAAVEPCDGAEITGLLGGAGLVPSQVADVGAGYSHGFELIRGRRPG